VTPECKATPAGWPETKARQAHIPFLGSLHCDSLLTSHTQHGQAKMMPVRPFVSSLPWTCPSVHAPFPFLVPFCFRGRKGTGTGYCNCNLHRPWHSIQQGCRSASEEKTTTTTTSTMEFLQRKISHISVILGSYLPWLYNQKRQSRFPLQNRGHLIDQQSGGIVSLTA